MTVVAALAIGIAVGIPMAIWSGFVLSVLWAWFFVPLGIPAISTAHGIGIALLTGFLRSYRKTDDVSGKDLFVSIGGWLIGSLLTLLIGWIVKGFMA